MRRILVVSMIWLWLGPLGGAGAEQQVTVMRDQAQLRKGPASYYEVLEIVAKGTRLTPQKTVAGWYQVDFQAESGYLSAKVTQPPPPRPDVFAQMATQPAALRLSQHGMSAGAKGFAKHFAQSVKGDPSTVEKVSAFHLDPAGYEAFKKETYGDLDVDRLRARFPLSTASARSSYSGLEQGVGMGIAGKIGTLKLYHNERMTDYVNWVGSIVAESSPGYDLPFKFFIIDQDAVNAYGCPGGYVFVTRGLLLHIQDEAELATVLAHEIAHVTEQHGLQELGKRKTLVIAEDAFAQLDEEIKDTDPKWKALEAELDEFALNAYETIFSGRLEGYELEADRLGMLYAARSGYDPTAMARLLERLAKAHTISTNEHYQADQIRKRLRAMKQVIASGRFKGRFFSNPERWQTYAASLK
jgi:hypothetical protein